MCKGGFPLSHVPPAVGTARPHWLCVSPTLLSLDALTGGPQPQSAVSHRILGVQKRFYFKIQKASAAFQSLKTTSGGQSLLNW